MYRLNLHNERELLVNIATGDNLAFRALFKSYWPSVFDTCFRLTKSSEQAKDLAQDIFLRLWDHRQTLVSVSNLDAFLYTISRNLVFNYLQKKVLHPSNIDILIDYFRHNGPDAQEMLEGKDLENNIRVAIDQLPDKVKEVFLLHRHEGLSHGEISERLNISVVSSKTYIVRALKNIRTYLAHHAEGWILLFFTVLNRYMN